MAHATVIGMELAASPDVIANVMDIDEMAKTVEERATPRLLLLVGFDGVLVDYEGDPAHVRLSAERCDALNALTDRPDIVLGIVSGRRVSDLRQCAPLGAKVFYVGLHGLEVEGPDVQLMAREAVESHRDRVHEIAATLEPSMSSVEGVRVEDKDGVIAVHTREARSQDAVWARIHLLSTAAHMIRRDDLRVVRGNHVIELLPNVPHPRATAIFEIRRHLQEHEAEPLLTLYIGEDAPDDDAFEALGNDGISAAVGTRASKARYRLTSTEEVWQLIARLAKTH